MRFFAACVPLLARRRLGDASPRQPRSQPPNAACTSLTEDPSRPGPAASPDITVAGAATPRATTAGSNCSTTYPATAPAPKLGARIRQGPLMTPSSTASNSAIGILADDVLPTLPMLK